MRLVLAVLLIFLATPPPAHGACAEHQPHISAVWESDGLRITHCSDVETANLYIKQPLDASWYYTGSLGSSDSVLLPRYGDVHLVPNPGAELILWSGFYEIARMEIPWPNAVYLPTIER